MSKRRLDDGGDVSLAPPSAKRREHYGNESCFSTPPTPSPPPAPSPPPLCKDLVLWRPAGDAAAVNGTLQPQPPPPHHHHPLQRWDLPTAASNNGDLKLLWRSLTPAQRGALRGAWDSAKAASAARLLLRRLPSFDGKLGQEPPSCIVEEIDDDDGERGGGEGGGNDGQLVPYDVTLPTSPPHSCNRCGGGGAAAAAAADGDGGDDAMAVDDAAPMED